MADDTMLIGWLGYSSVSGDPGRPETVIAKLGFDAGCRSAPADHRISASVFFGEMSHPFNKMCEC
jgi:hypothetical protein